MHLSRRRLHVCVVRQARRTPRHEAEAISRCEEVELISTSKEMVVRLREVTQLVSTNAMLIERGKWQGKSSRASSFGRRAPSRAKK